MHVGVLLAHVMHYGGCKLVWVDSVILIGSRVSAQRKSYWLGKQLMGAFIMGVGKFLYIVLVWGLLPIWTMRVNFRRFVISKVRGVRLQLSGHWRCVWLQDGECLMWERAGFIRCLRQAVAGKEAYRTLIYIGVY